MTSQRKIAANKINGAKSRGPRTSAGKRKASRNALRHGLSAVSHRNPASIEEIEQIAKSMCDGEQDPQLYEQAVLIAENDLWIRCVQTEKLAVIERMRDPAALPLVKRRGWQVQAEIRIAQRDIAHTEYSQLYAKLKSQGEKLDFSLMPLKCEPNEPPRRFESPAERDEHEAMRVAQPDLQRLERYERRAWARRKKAIRRFTVIKLVAHLRALEAKAGSSK